MTYKQFSELSFTQQCLLVKNAAIELARRSDPLNGYILFQLDSFYIEIKTDPYFDIAKELIAFECTDMLNNYVEAIDISTVFP
ncbi:MAG: hypothetical protein QM737_15870 [Ferruginibacter sp.]